MVTRFTTRIIAGVILWSLFQTTPVEVLGGMNGSETPQHENVPQDSLTFSVLGMSCRSCAKSAGKMLQAIPGVQGASVDFDQRLARLAADTTVARSDIRRALATLGFEAEFPDDPPRPIPLTEQQKAKLDIRTVSHGQAIEIKKHLVAGKYTIFDYYAGWCGPCRLLTPKLERFVLDSTDSMDVALRKVDISDWKSEAARQATREFQLPALPYVRVYGPDGVFLGSVKGNNFDKIKALIDRNIRQE